MDYNERHFLASVAYGVEQTRTDVEFVDYVKQFIKLVYDEDKKRADGANTAAA
jgi:hypothetical protein